MTLNKLINGRSIYAWRFLILIMLGLFGFFGTRLYASIDRNTATIYGLAEHGVSKTDIVPLQADIRELRGEIRELNGYLRDNRVGGPKI